VGRHPRSGALRRTLGLLRSRPGRLCDEFPELVAVADVLGQHRATLDGELVVLRDDGRPDFALLRQRLGRTPRNPHPVTFVVFDLLHLDGCSTRDLPYRERRLILDELALEGPYWRTPACLRLKDPDALVRRVAALGLEGIVSKQLDAAYRPGRRSASWIKTKLRRQERLAVTGLRRTRESRVEAVIVARRLPDGSTRPAGSIEIGLRHDAIRQLEDSLASLPSRRRGKVTWFPAEVSVVASCHGLPDGPVRDAVLRDVL
jgi:bifunctional non-homologous end joining protein LigD